MAGKVSRLSVDLSAYPNLVVLYLGMRANTLRGVWTMLRFGPKIQASVDAKPDGLLCHEQFVFSVFPPHVGMRQYWRDFESVETWSRSMPHQQWWQRFLRDSGGTGFWHETYFMGGGMEAIYDDLPSPIGLAHFAPQAPARGAMFSARKRAGKAGEPSVPAPIPEDQL
jgi:hypothetical protein